ncbi:hypothetical protein [Deinococcus humi]|uniref:Uncharacterized protein n=1 Tax=Deinococcus humi TaxID=662880 RepID=A0A7W8JUX9_9DEIO|nr:hypothetical protein [Deinococcus humi]MBB5363687.1 hypothetical protein [Deinococcus humi]
MARSKTDLEEIQRPSSVAPDDTLIRKLHHLDALGNNRICCVSASNQSLGVAAELSD